MSQIMVGHLVLAGAGVGAVLLGALGLRLLAGRDAVLRYRIMAGAVLAAALLLPLQVLTSELTLGPSSPPPRASPGAGPVAARAPVAPFVEQISTGAPAPRASLVSLAARSVGASSGADVSSVFLAVYAAGLAAVAGALGVRAARARRLLRSARPATDPRVLETWGRIIAGVRRPPALLECGGLDAPACRAVGRPAVIVPASSGNANDETLRAVLRHELIHLQRGDGLVALLMAGTTTLLWFQPFVWVFARVLRADREHSCDALVVRETGRPRSYALALLRFCDPGASLSRSAPLIGFESARSIRRRITMLAHALQPAGRRRQALVLGAGILGVLSASAAHALLTVTAGPGPALRARSSATAAQTSPGDETAGQARTTIEIRAAADGRSDAQVFRRLVSRGLLTLNDLQQRDPPWAFPAADDAGKGVRAPSPTVTDEEVVFSAAKAHATGQSLNAKRVRLRLPDGSKLRAVLDGRTVTSRSDGKEMNHFVVTGGTVRIVDERGVTRVEARADSSRGDVALALTSAAGAGGITLDLAVPDDSSQIAVHLDSQNGPVENEPRPPHGVVRWQFLESPANAGSYELRMQWIYDPSTLRPEGC